VLRQLDGDVAARDARVREQARVLEEDMHELPEHVIGGLLHLLDDPAVVALDGEREVGLDPLRAGQRDRELARPR